MADVEETIGGTASQRFGCGLNKMTHTVISVVLDKTAQNEKLPLLWRGILCEQWHCPA